MAERMPSLFSKVGARRYARRLISESFGLPPVLREIVQPAYWMCSGLIYATLGNRRTASGLARQLEGYEQQTLPTGPLLALPNAGYVHAFNGNRPEALRLAEKVFNRSQETAEEERVLSDLISAARIRILASDRDGAHQTAKMVRSLSPMSAAYLHAINRKKSGKQRALELSDRIKRSDPVGAALIRALTGPEEARRQSARLVDHPLPPYLVDPWRAGLIHALYGDGERVRESAENLERTSRGSFQEEKMLRVGVLHAFGSAREKALDVADSLEAHHSRRFAAIVRTVAILNHFCQDPRKVILPFLHNALWLQREIRLE